MVTRRPYRCRRPGHGSTLAEAFASAFSFANLRPIAARMAAGTAQSANARTACRAADCIGSVPDSRICHLALLCVDGRLGRPARMGRTAGPVISGSTDVAHAAFRGRESHGELAASTSVR
jgi:hypothetical protein